MHGNKKNVVDFFIGCSSVEKILGKDYKLSSHHTVMLTEFFNCYTDGDRSNIWRKNIAIWLKYNLDNWIVRRESLRTITSNSQEWFKLMYGESWEELYNLAKCNIIKNLPNRIEYWSNKGYSNSEAKVKVSEVQLIRARISGDKLRNTSEYTIRSTKYWEKKGYSQDEASQIVRSLQLRDLDFYIYKYGVIEGTARYEKSKSRRKKTWENKDKAEHARKTTPASFNPVGLEMQAINGFITTNNISVLNCRFGPPSEQFWQHIPEIGYRRYDLAVFEDSTCTKLKYIFEFHGPGHINFSDYRPELENEMITIDGKKLAFLGTYGSSYKNDLIKREHILNNYPDVKYIVMWTDDLKFRRFTIEQLLNGQN